MWVKDDAQKKNRVGLQNYRVGVPMERIAIDILGPLPETDRKNRYIVVIWDYLTRWIEAFRVKSQDAATFAEVLVEEFISRFGVPR